MARTTYFLLLVFVTSVACSPTASRPIVDKQIGEAVSFTPFTPGEIVILSDLQAGVTGDIAWSEHFMQDFCRLEANEFIDRDLEGEIDENLEFPLATLTDKGRVAIDELFPVKELDADSDESDKCSLHDAALSQQPIPVVYGTVEITFSGRKYYEVENALFPHGPQITRRPTKSSDDTHKSIEVCPECIVARDKWLSENPTFQHKTKS